MTKVYNKLGSVIIEQTGKDKIYLNPDDIRLSVSGEVFLINDAQLNRMYQLGTFEQIVDANDIVMADKAACETYLLSSTSTMIEDGMSEPAYVSKRIITNAAETWTKIEWFSDAMQSGAPLKIQEIVIAGETDRTEDTSKTIIITNS